MITSGRRLLRLVALLGAALAASRAQADGIGATVNPSYSTSNSTTTDETGRTTKSQANALVQQYRLNLDETIYPALLFSAGGNLYWTDGWSRSDDLSTRSSDKAWSGYARLRFGDPLLGGGLDYDRRWEDTSTTTSGVTQSAPGPIRESYTGNLAWHPADLPTLDLRLSRTDSYDSLRQVLNVTVDEAALATRYEPNKDSSLRYAVRASDSQDHLHDFETRTLENSLATTWTDKFLDGRGTAYIGYNVGARNTEVLAGAGSTGQIFTPQLPTGGLSKVEKFPDTPDHVALDPNTKLIDGVTTSTGGVSASAGINIGTSGDVVTDRAVRDIGAQFANTVTPVSEIDVWVDQQLPSGIAAGFTWTVYQSDDNLNWTEVVRAGPVEFDLFTPRFKIPIARISARYLKVSTCPLSAALTTDPRYAEISVTEVQFYDVSSVADKRGRSFDLGGSLNGSARLALVRSIGLSYDTSLLVTHTNGAGGVTWSILNGLSATQRLSPVWSTSERVDRADSDYGAGHEASNRWSVSVGVDPLPTLGGLVNYSGQLTQRPKGTAIANSVSGTLRAELYEGISASANTSAGVVQNEQGRFSRSITQAGSLSLVPNRVLQVTTTVSYTASVSTGGGQAELSTKTGLAEAAASLSPFPALGLTGSVLRYFWAEHPSTLASFSGGFSPFPGGALQLRYGYTETLDTLTDTRTRTHGPGARWNIRPGWYLEGGYSWNQATSPLVIQSGRVGSVNLFITLR